MQPPAPPRSPARQRVRRAGFVALAAGIAYALLGLPLFVFPPSDPLPKHADVAMVLGPVTPERNAEARTLLARGVVSTVVWSVPREVSEAGTWQQRKFAVCFTRPTLVCRYANPHTTQGEARMLRSLAAAHGWRSAIVITGDPHLNRARLIVGRCFTGRLTMRAVAEAPYLGWPYQYAYQTAATVKAWLNPGC